MPRRITICRRCRSKPFRSELEAFLQCVRDRSRPIVAGEDGMAAVELAARVSVAIEESLRRIGV